MARSLPLQSSLPIATPFDISVGERTLSGTVAVFDPAMCCATGVCGPGVDPALLTIARDLRWLEAQGVTVQRAGLGQEPQAFVANAKVTGLMQAFGDNALPAVLVNNAVLVYGRYPTRDELVHVLSASALEDARGAQADGGACAPGTGCC